MCFVGGDVVVGIQESRVGMVDVEEEEGKDTAMDDYLISGGSDRATHTTRS